MGVSGQHHAPAALYPGERTPSIHWTGGWVGLRAGLDAKVRRKILCLCRGLNTVVQSVVRHYTDWATPALYIIRLGWIKYVCKYMFVKPAEMIMCMLTHILKLPCAKMCTIKNLPLVICKWKKPILIKGLKSVQLVHRKGMLLHIPMPEAGHTDKQTVSCMQLTKWLRC
jgi:hypothetical protein